MRKHTYTLMASTLLLFFSHTVLADTNTNDSTNQYSPANQDQEKMHQKPGAQDKSGSSETSTTTTRHGKHKMHKSTTKGDTGTSDSTNQYSPANQDKEKMHQKPAAGDESTSSPQ